MFDYRLEEDASRFAVFYENEEIGEISFVKTGEHLLIIDHLQSSLVIIYGTPLRSYSDYST